MAENFRNRQYGRRTTGGDWWDDAGYRNSGRDRDWDEYSGPGYGRNTNSGWGYRNQRNRDMPFGYEGEGFGTYGYGGYNMSDYGFGSNAGHGGGYGARESGRYGADYDGYRSGYGNRDRGYGFNRDWENDPDNRYRRSRYDSSHGDRDWWDRTTDEVASWFGDEDAERRRRRDKTEGAHRGKGPKGYRRSDDRIREDVNDRLYEDPWVDASDVEVTVNNSEVTLTGHVTSRGEKRRIEDLVESISGVQHVENRLRVTVDETSQRNRDYTYPTATTTGGATNTDSRVENGKSRTSRTI